MHLPQLAALQSVSDGAKTPASGSRGSEAAKGFQGVFAQADANPGSQEDGAGSPSPSAAKVSDDSVGKETTGADLTTEGDESGTIERSGESAAGEAAEPLFTTVQGNVANPLPETSVLTGANPGLTDGGSPEVPGGPHQSSAILASGSVGRLGATAATDAQTASGEPEQGTVSAASPGPDKGPLATVRGQTGGGHAAGSTGIEGANDPAVVGLAPGRTGAAGETETTGATGTAGARANASSLPQAGAATPQTFTRSALPGDPTPTGAAEAGVLARSNIVDERSAAGARASGNPSAQAMGSGSSDTSDTSGKPLSGDVAPGQTEQTGETAAKTGGAPEGSGARQIDQPFRALRSQQAQRRLGDDGAPAAGSSTREGDTPPAQAAQAASRATDATPAAATAAGVSSALSVKYDPLHADVGEVAFEPGEVAFEPSVGAVEAGGNETRASARLAGPAPQFAGADAARNAALQIVDIVRSASERVVELRLQPEELGRVQLTMSQDATGALTVSLNVERTETLDLLRRNIDLLGAELRDLGYGSVDFSFNGEGAEGREDRTAEFGETPMASAATVATAEAVASPDQVKVARPGAPGAGIDMRL